jgi:sulfoacetaldehyde dehydrogenase
MQAVTAFQDVSASWPPSARRGLERAAADQRFRALASALRQPGLMAELAAAEIRATGRGRARDRTSRLTGIVTAACSRLEEVQPLGELEMDGAGEILFARPLGTIEVDVGVVDGSAFALAALLVAARTGNAVRMAVERPLAPVLEQLADRLCAKLVRTVATIGAVEDGPGNVMLVDETADIATAAGRLIAAKATDNGTGRAAPAAVLAVGSSGPALLAAMLAGGAWRLDAEAADRAAATLWREGMPNRTLVGRDARVLTVGLGLPPAAAAARLFVAEADAPALAGPLMRLRDSLVLAFWQLADWPSAVEALQRYAEAADGMASLVLESRRPERARALAASVDIRRIDCGASEDPILLELEPGGRLDWQRLVRLTRLRLAPAG